MLIPITYLVFHPLFLIGFGIALVSFLFLIIPRQNKKLTIPAVMLAIGIFLMAGVFSYQLSKIKPLIKANLEKRTPKKNVEVQKPLPVIEAENNQWATYKNARVQFNYPNIYNLTDQKTCVSVTDNSTSCLLSLQIDSKKDMFTPTGSVLVVRPIKDINISGQVSSIKYNPAKKTWVLDDMDKPAQSIPVWDKTLDGREIIKTSNGGSHGESDFYMIADYKNDLAVVFVFPTAFRIRCDMIDSNISSKACADFYKSIFNDYKADLIGQSSDDFWLPESYLKKTYSSAEDMVRSTKL